MVVHYRFVYLLNWFFTGLVQWKRASGASTDGLKVATNISEMCCMLHVFSDTKSAVQGGGGGGAAGGLVIYVGLVLNPAMWLSSRPTHFERKSAHKKERYFS